MVVEGNVCHDASSLCFHQHYGLENLVRHNVFAFGGHGQISVTRPEEHVPFTFERNVVLGAGMPALISERADVWAYDVVSDLNLYWDVDGSFAPAGNTPRTRAS